MISLPERTTSSVNPGKSQIPAGVSSLASSQHKISAATAKTVPDMIRLDNWSMENNKSHEPNKTTVYKNVIVTDGVLAGKAPFLRNTTTQGILTCQVKPRKDLNKFTIVSLGLKTLHASLSRQSRSPGLTRTHF
jgi:hypothetical protein